MQKLLISVRGPREAMEAARGGAHIADVEYPASALGTPYPLNIYAVREVLDKHRHSTMAVSTNIGEKQHDRSSACQAALGAATAGADVIKCGLAELPFDAAVYQGETLVRTIKKFFPKKKVIPSVFVDEDMQRFLDPLKEGPKLAARIGADGILVDTYNKSTGVGLLDYCSLREVGKLVSSCRKLGIGAWIAGSITAEELPDLWSTGVDVICIRGAACEQKGVGRFGRVKADIVAQLVATMSS